MHRIIFIALCVLWAGGAYARPVQTHQLPGESIDHPVHWYTPHVAPYLGSFRKMLEHARDQGLVTQENVEAYLNLYDSRGCTTEDVPEGALMLMSETHLYGGDDFIYIIAHPLRFPPGASRKMLVCRIQSSPHAFVVPEACGNAALWILPAVPGQEGSVIPFSLHEGEALSSVSGEGGGYAPTGFAAAAAFGGTGAFAFAPGGVPMHVPYPPLPLPSPLVPATPTTSRVVTPPESPNLGPPIVPLPHEVPIPILVQPVSEPGSSGLLVVALMIVWFLSLVAKSRHVRQE